MSLSLITFPTGQPLDHSFGNFVHNVATVAVGNSNNLTCHKVLNVIQLRKTSMPLRYVYVLCTIVVEREKERNRIYIYFTHLYLEHVPMPMHLRQEQNDKIAIVCLWLKIKFLENNIKWKCTS